MKLGLLSFCILFPHSFLISFFFISCLSFFSLSSLFLFSFCFHPFSFYCEFFCLFPIMSISNLFPKLFAFNFSRCFRRVRSWLFPWLRAFENDPKTQQEVLQRQLCINAPSISSCLWSTSSGPRVLEISNSENSHLLDYHTLIFLVQNIRTLCPSKMTLYQGNVDFRGTFWTKMVRYKVCYILLCYGYISQPKKH